jgi:DNA polymerase-1
LKQPVLKTTAKYQEAADDEALVLLSEWCEKNTPDNVPLFKLVQEYRRWGKSNPPISTVTPAYNAATGVFMPTCSRWERKPGACRPQAQP